MKVIVGCLMLDWKAWNFAFFICLHLQLNAKGVRLESLGLSLGHSALLGVVGVGLFFEFVCSSLELSGVDMDSTDLVVVVVFGCFEGIVIC